MFGEATTRLPRVEPRRAVVETAEMRGLSAAILELGGLPDDEDDEVVPVPESFGRLQRLRRERAIPRGLETPGPANDVRPPETPDGRAPEVGVVEPPEWTPGRARVP